MNRKKFNLSELKAIPSLVFTPTTKIELPENLETLLFLLRKIQSRNFVEKFQNEKLLEELSQQELNEDVEFKMAEINQKLSQIEYSRHRLHTIYTQILLHLFHTKQLELLYVQSHESQPDVKNVLTVNYGAHTHRFQVKSSLITEFNLEYRGVRYKKDPTALEAITDEQIAEYGYSTIDVIRECRRISNYLTKRAKAKKERNSKINVHNIVIGEIRKKIAAGEATLVDDRNSTTEIKVEPTQKKAKEKEQQKQAKSVVKPQRSSSKKVAPSGAVEAQAKKPINVIRKRSFKLNK